MPEQVPISEVRRVVIEYEIRVPRGGMAPARTTAAPQTATASPELVDAVRRELIRIGSRNPDIFGGRA